MFDQDGVGNDQSRKAFLTSLTPSHHASSTLKGVPSHGFTLDRIAAGAEKKSPTKRKVFNGDAYKNLKNSPVEATGRASDMGNITEAAKEEFTPKSLNGVSKNLNKDL